MLENRLVYYRKTDNTRMSIWKNYYIFCGTFERYRLILRYNIKNGCSISGTIFYDISLYKKKENTLTITLALTNKNNKIVRGNKIILLDINSLNKLNIIHRLSNAMTYDDKCTLEEHKSIYNEYLNNILQTKTMIRDFFGL